MSYSISIKNVGLEYTQFVANNSTLKEFVANCFRSGVQPKKFSALKGINLELHEGARLGIIGLNGSGKSTLLKVITGILHPTSGKINVKGSIQPLIEIGAGFNPEFTGRENIYFNGYLLGFTSSEIKRKEWDIVEFADIGDFIDTPTKYYSTGMTARLAFAIATNINPEILVFDEMISAGDAVFIRKAKEKINTLLEAAKMLVIVSHDLELLKDITDRSIVLDSGEIIFEGETESAIKFYLNRNF